MADNSLPSASVLCSLVSATKITAFKVTNSHCRWHNLAGDCRDDGSPQPERNSRELGASPGPGPWSDNIDDEPVDDTGAEPGYFGDGASASPD